MKVIVNPNKVEKAITMLDGMHLPFVGKLAVLTELGVCISEQYRQLYGIGNPEQDYNLYYHYQTNGKYSIKLMFINEPSIQAENHRFFCLKEVGIGIGRHGDWHWYTLDQLMICC
jgi:hypothetical protein